MSSESTNREENKICPETLARYFGYYRQFVNGSRYVKTDVNRVNFKSCYAKYRKYFVKLVEICEKYGINAHNFIEYCVKSRLACTPDQMLSTNMFRKYADSISTKERYSNIYKNYVKSARNVAIYCIENGTTPIEYIKSLIDRNQLAYEYVTGVLSKHFIASLQNFDKLFYRLDRINREELSTIHDVVSELNDELQEVFLMYKNRRVKPLGLAETIINQIKNR